ncbi:UDP-N-acetylmuramoyl-L-alanyl-D-glutamate--2,6-diaminopimelate ligase [Shewanella yunxiaonensis]|uniref:UDP-N-acetylmuramyl-tripeptide synthetase n=1 Tax=Shewanella yunxiaonensis TaxID=2829809 RepID=A0ABX7YTV6_9GAMM|nr:UDP-N-acetylmuramoyl-L-alanyl-D-glutamate--2,6-diaminopimelate ligase [Shewanella yunxiaonensis]QUN06132.1 UDP-N-acetylmuramoyl-L-alanyl-D-glutamate--2,6-diaminopimelate ligase [Shewanella yunxiaonensis]
MMLLKDLLAPWFHYAGSEVVGAPTLDSRKIVDSGLFIAVPGFKTDGREYIAAAFKNGATAVLKHTDNPDDHGKVGTADGLVIEFFRLNRQVSAIAAQYYGLIAGKPRIVGVTGTNGKTSVTQLIAQWVELYGQQAGVMGTLGNGRPGQLQDTGNTTADAITLMAQFKQMGEAGVDVCAMEVSSHGLVQGRVDAVPFEIAVFTNLSRDHLDFHKSMEAYAAAKQRLLRFPTVKKAALNLDDHTGSTWFDSLDRQRLLGFSIHNDPRASLLALDADYHHAGIQARIKWPEGEGQLQTPLLGEFNLSNLLAALSALYALGYPLQQMLALAPKLQPVPGRMECFVAPTGFSIVVDYAHTPDGLEKALVAAREHCTGRLWCVFGCGGDRDTGKRPQMAAIAERLADRVMITSDNIRSEDPQQIINDIMAGLTHPQQVLTEVDRVQAIHQVVSQAQAGDLIVLAGKGHETYQEIAGVKHHYDERALARELCGGQQ